MTFAFPGARTEVRARSGAWNFVPRHLLADERYVQDLTFRNPAYDNAVRQARPEDVVDVPPAIRAYKETRDAVWLPRHYAPKLIAGAKPTLRTYGVNVGPRGHELPPLVTTATPRDERQVEAVQWLGRPEDGRLMARAGAGKTIMALMAAAKLGVRPILVVVHEQGTMQQWVDRIVTHTTTPEDDVGVVQGQRADFRHTITVAMMHTLALGDLRDSSRWDELKRWVHGGLVVYDELDVYAPSKMSNGLSMFAATRWGLTATYRHDGLQPLLNAHIGDRELYHGGYALDPLIVSCRINVPSYTRRFQQSRSLLGHLEDHDKTWRSALQKLCTESLDQGRKTMLLMERVEAIETMGLWAKERGYDYGVVHGGVKKKDRIERLSRRLVIANRRIAGRALDMPDLETVIVSPSGNPALMEQVAGRTLREHAGKQRPVVVLVWPYCRDGSGTALSILGNLATKAERSLRSCGFDEVVLDER